MLMQPGPDPAHHGFLETDRLVTGRVSVRDVVVNVAAFVPSGMLVYGGLAAASWRLSEAARVGIVVLGALVVSLAAESAQFFVPGRYSSLADVVANVAGAAVGLLIERLRAGHR